MSDIEKVKDAAGKALGDVNAEVQKTGAESMSWVQKNKWVIGLFVGLVVILFVVGLAVK